MLKGSSQRDLKIWNMFAPIIKESDYMNKQIGRTKGK